MQIRFAAATLAVFAAGLAASGAPGLDERERRPPGGLPDDGRRLRRRREHVPDVPRRHADRRADGTRERSFPAGTYTIVLNNNSLDDLGNPHSFHLTGPGVNLAAGGVVQTTWTATFQPPRPMSSRTTTPRPHAMCSGRRVGRDRHDGAGADHVDRREHGNDAEGDEQQPARHEASARLDRLSRHAARDRRPEDADADRRRKARQVAEVGPLPDRRDRPEREERVHDPADQAERDDRERRLVRRQALGDARAGTRAVVLLPDVRRAKTYFVVFRA